MKTLFRVTILFVLTCPSAVITIAQTRPTSATVSAADVVPLTSRQPFPFHTGVAMAMPTYSGIKAKISAAQTLKIASRRAVDSLTVEANALRGALADQQRLTRHDEATTVRLLTDLATAQTRLTTASQQLTQATAILDQVRAWLPRRYRKRATTDAALGLAFEEYTERLARRPLKWGVGGAVLGALGTLVLLIL